MISAIILGGVLGGTISANRVSPSQGWWPGTESNRRRQPFQFVVDLYLQRLDRFQVAA
jgi:hypothetical protein